MIEIEVKGYASKDVERRLDKRFELVEERFQIDIYLNHPCRDFRITDEALRLRREIKNSTEKFLLTYKGPRTDPKSKTREEIEVEVSDYERTVNLLKKLGFEQVCTIKKRRKIYRHRDFMISFDEVEGLGLFVEIEKAVLTREDVPRIRDEMITILREIGVQKFERRSYLEMIMNK